MSANGAAKINDPEAGRFDKSAGMTIEVAGAALFAHACGVVYWPDEATLIVADLHLEKGSHFATKQIFLPPYDTSATLATLDDAVAAFRPARVIALGDSFHDGKGPERLTDKDRQALDTLVGATDFIWIFGNHDPALPVDLGGRFETNLTIGPLTFRHEPTINAEEGEVAGHLHPCARVRGRGRTVRSRCFVANTKRLILPAFGAFTGGLNVRDEAFHSLFPGGQYHAYMMGNDRVYPISNSSCLPG